MLFGLSWIDVSLGTERRTGLSSLEKYTTLYPLVLKTVVVRLLREGLTADPLTALPTSSQSLGVSKASKGVPIVAQ